MLRIVLASVVLGLAVAVPQDYYSDYPDYQDDAFSPTPTQDAESGLPYHEVARLNFLKEYERLAQVALDAPDIHIIMSDRLPEDQRLKRPPVPVDAFKSFGFTASLGDDQEFFPRPDTFPDTPTHEGEHSPAQR